MKVILIFFITLSGLVFGQENIQENNQIKQTALSFYDWYVKAINTGSGIFDAFVVRNNDDMCRLDTSAYFNEIRKLGTISEKFILSEKIRFKCCSEGISKISWQEYKYHDDPYAYDNICPTMSYYFWIHSQELPDGVELKTITVDKNKAEAVLVLYNLSDNNKVYWPEPYPIVCLEKESKIWKITRINPE